MVKLLNEAQVRNWPAPWPHSLTALCDALAAGLNEELVAVFVHGSVARGHFHVETSNLDLGIVLQRATAEILRRMAHPLQLARAEARIESIILLADELSHVSEVFPIFYEDMRRHHVLLYGQDPWMGFESSAENLALRIEQELREVQIRLRRSYLDNAIDTTYLLGSLDGRIRQLRSPLAALMSLRAAAAHRHAVEMHDEDGVLVLKDAANMLNVDVNPVLVGAASRRDGHVAADALMRLLDAAVAEAGRLRAGGGTP
jgi:hypothetical protein